MDKLIPQIRSMTIDRRLPGKPNFPSYLDFRFGEKIAKTLLFDRRKISDNVGVRRGTIRQ